MRRNYSNFKVSNLGGEDNEFVTKSCVIVLNCLSECRLSGYLFLLLYHLD